MILNWSCVLLFSGLEQFLAAKDVHPQHQLPLSKSKRRKLRVGPCSTRRRNVIVEPWNTYVYVQMFLYICILNSFMYVQICSRPHIICIYMHTYVIWNVHKYVCVPVTDAYMVPNYRSKLCLFYHTRNAFDLLYALRIVPSNYWRMVPAHDWNQ